MFTVNQIFEDIRHDLSESTLTGKYAALWNYNNFPDDQLVEYTEKLIDFLTSIRSLPSTKEAGQDMGVKFSATHGADGILHAYGLSLYQLDKKGTTWHHGHVKRLGIDISYDIPLSNDPFTVTIYDRDERPVEFFDSVCIFDLITNILDKNQIN